jgi:hypothetical protein
MNHETLADRLQGFGLANSVGGQRLQRWSRRAGDDRIEQSRVHCAALAWRGLDDRCGIAYHHLQHSRTS